MIFLPCMCLNSWLTKKCATLEKCLCNWGWGGGGVGGRQGGVNYGFFQAFLSIRLQMT